MIGMKFQCCIKIIKIICNKGKISLSTIETDFNSKITTVEILNAEKGTITK